MSRSMKMTAFVLLGVLIVAMLSTSGYCGKNKKDLPEFFLPMKTVNVGEFIEGSDINYTFKIRNKGSGELQILNVRPG
ncbi:MAG: hypothetical protein KAX38_01480 [Candidatus Krumholzibacteria bacterium]|nr:hypothetical protein [Candidatus Krumholzibacteria bacterium]